MLECYSLEEVLEYNDLTPEDALIYLVENEFLELPEIQPLEL